MLTMLLLTFAGFAGEVKISEAPGLAFRRLFSICEPLGEKCAGGKCKMSVTAMKCERVPGTQRGTCLFKCNGNEHMLSGEQAMEVFKVLEPQKKLLVEVKGRETFQDASLTCEALKSEVSGTCKLKHAKIK